MTTKAWNRRVAPEAAAETETSTPVDYGSNGARAERVRGARSRTPYLDAASAEGDTGDYLVLETPAGAGATLEQTLLTALARPDVTFGALDRKIAAADVADRQLAFRSDALQQAIAASALTPAEQLALSTTLADGSLKWARGGRGSVQSDFYTFFGLNDGKGPPPPMNQMTCYELILYQAWRLGQIPTAWIVSLYDAGSNTLPDTPSYAGMGFSPDLPVVTDPAVSAPAVGDMVFISFPTAPEPWHVVLALGGDSAMSLWKKPKLDSPGARVTLSEHLADGERVQYGPPPWR